MARAVSTKIELLNQDLQHLRETLTKCKYPKGALDKIERKLSRSNQDGNNMDNNQDEPSGGNNDSNNGDPERRETTKDRYTKGHIVIPYTQGLGKASNIYAGDMGPRPNSRKIEL